MRNIWHFVVRFSGPCDDGWHRTKFRCMKSERRELRRRIQKCFKQKEMSVRRFQHAAPLDHKPDNLVHINIGTDEKPKYVWRVCK